MKNLLFYTLFFAAITLIAACKDQSAEITTGTTPEAKTEAKAPKAHGATVASEKSTATNAPKPKEDPFVAGGLEWLTMEQAGKLSNADNKKYLVDVYTDWCGWCKVMDKKTFTDPKVQEYLDEKYHIVKFNAEQKEPIDFRGKTYEWMPAGRKGVNKLAMEIMNGRLSYPTLVYFDEDFNKLKVSPGYKKPDQLLAELKVLE